MADDAAPPGKSKITESFKKHKGMWIAGGIIGIILIWFIIKYYSGSSSSSASQNAANGQGAAGFAGQSPVDLTGIQGPPGPAGPPGKRGPKGPPGKNPKPPKKKHHGPVKSFGPRDHPGVQNGKLPPGHLLPQHTSNTLVRPDASHAAKGG